MNMCDFQGMQIAFWEKQIRVHKVHRPWPKATTEEIVRKFPWNILCFLKYDSEFTWKFP